MNENLKDGYIIDYISGQEIKTTPEEVEAVQPFSKQLVEDYGYSKEEMQTRPQFRVKSSPSDIAIFQCSKKSFNSYIMNTSSFSIH